MEEGTPKRPLVLLGLIVASFLLFSVLGVQPPYFSAWLSHASSLNPPPLHADEAVQWSLAKEISEGVPYSSNNDRFHGPTLAASLMAASKVTGTAFTEMSESYLRNVTGCYLVLLSLAVLALPGVCLMSRVTAAVFCFVVGGAAPFGFYYVQEVLLVAGLAWGVVLWLRAEASERKMIWRLLSGAAFGFALACKVTAAAYLLLFFIALMIVRKTWADRNLLAFIAGLVASWAFFQSVAFTDVPGLVTWWSQLARSLGVASGHSEDTLTALSYWPWLWAALWLVVFSTYRFLSQRAIPFRSGPYDFALVFVGLLFGFHLLLPYKTPWLLYGVMALPLVLVLPYHFSGGWRRDGWLLLGLLIATGVAAGDFASHSPTADLRAFVASTARFKAAYKGGPFYVAIDDGHYWPLPYYLRHYQVGYGAFPAAAKAPLRLILANDTSEPKVAGYVVHRLTLRKDGTEYWVLVAKEYESVFNRP